MQGGTVAPATPVLSVFCVTVAKTQTHPQPGSIAPATRGDRTRARQDLPDLRGYTGEADEQEPAAVAEAWLLAQEEFLRATGLSRSLYMTM